MDETRRAVVTNLVNTVTAMLVRAPDNAGPALDALVDLCREYDDAIADEADRAFGRGYRAGRDDGIREGWEERDREARHELAQERLKRQAAEHALDAARRELSDPIGEYVKEAEAPPKRRRRAPLVN